MHHFTCSQHVSKHQHILISIVYALYESILVLDLMLCMPIQHYAIGLQTDCMVIVPAPMVRLPDSHAYAL